MNSTGRRVAKNASVLLVAQLITWGMAVLLTVIMPRFLGPAAIGKYQLANSLWAIVGIAVTFGMDMLLTKEVARTPEKSTELFGTSIILRTFLFVFGIGVLALYIYAVGYPLDTIYIILIIGVANLIYQFAGVCQAVLQGLERMEYVSLSDIVSKIFITSLAIILLLAGYGIFMVALVVVGGALVSFLFQYLALRKLQPIRINFDRSTAWWMLKSGYPYLLNIGVRTVYIQIDVVILSWLVSETVLGWYSASSRLFSTFLFIPTVLMMAAFPAMSRMHTADPESMPKLIRKNFDLLLLFGIPIGLGLFVMANPLVDLLFGSEFAASGPVLAIMGLVLIFTYQNMLLGQNLISTDRQHIWTRVMAVATLATLPLDLIFIPYFQNIAQNGAIGGAVSFLLTEVAMFLCGLWLLPRGTLRRSNLGLAIRVLFSGLVMAAVSWPLRDTFILIPIGVGVVVYAGMILVLRVIPKDDWLLLRSILQNLIIRLRKPKAEPTRIGG
jgi:O-antigen/teichoic acid export membrane protein